MRFADKVIWITGASSGVGEALAKAFHAEGARLIISARRPDELARVKSECTGKGEILALPFDVIDEFARAAAVKQALSVFGHVDMLVNNAGVSQRSQAKDTQLAVDRRIMEIDYFSVIALTKLLLPSMIERKSGHIVVNTSASGKFGVWMRTAYCAAKHALHGFFDALRVELITYNIDVSLLVFGGVQTKVSLNALTGDGTPWGKLDNLVIEGTPLDECVRIVLNGLAAKKHEIVVADPATSRFLFLKRFAPGMLFRRQTKRARKKAKA
jgi:NADP-dependent 3-hydroxy acid dehydrogenase YdfG